MPNPRRSGDLDRNNWALALVGGPASPYQLASLGGSTVFLFGLTRTPAAQPRALLGGHLGAALIGIVCYQCFGCALWVYILAEALTLSYMLVTKTLHPPAGANPIPMISHHAGLYALWQPVFLGVFSLALVAFFWSRILRGTFRYPTNQPGTSPPFASWGTWHPTPDSSDEIPTEAPRMMSEEIKTAISNLSVLEKLLLVEDILDEIAASNSEPSMPKRQEARAI
jgi:CBS-domain-containing membrane protein